MLPPPQRQQKSVQKRFTHRQAPEGTTFHRQDTLRAKNTDMAVLDICILSAQKSRVYGISKAYMDCFF